MNLPLLRLVVSQLPGWSYATGNAPKPLIWKIEIASYECMLGRLQSEGNMKKTWDLFWQHTKMVWWAGLLNNWIISMCFSFVTLMLMVTSGWTCNWLESGWIFFWFEYVIKTYLYDINIKHINILQYDIWTNSSSCLYPGVFSSNDYFWGGGVVVYG